MHRIFCQSRCSRRFKSTFQANWWDTHVEHLQKAIQNTPDMPPLIVHYMMPEGQAEGTFELNDGNTRFEAYSRLGLTEAKVIVWITDRYEYDQFIERFGCYLSK